ncbi:EamA family transporter [Microbacterium amylolyticum]|uniref:EamA domain-containing membrane protein RarD n=1 Tax=Microbacterium amylolyticum TaxID=936337 RepID=A0ABS4ZJF4_9MICO|nr:EamA domain-containing membrane protein RarD [Microbacterium amylolyticum]
MTTHSTPVVDTSDLSTQTRLGVGYGFAAYALWGLLPLYFVALAPTGPWETLGWRVVLSLVFCAVLLTVTRSWLLVLAVFRSPRLLMWTLVAGILIYANWQGFLFAAQTGHVLEASLGYFINPIATILLAVVFLHERLRPLQWVAVGVAAIRGTSFAVHDRSVSSSRGDATGTMGGIHHRVDRLHHPDRRHVPTGQTDAHRRTLTNPNSVVRA